MKWISAALCLEITPVFWETTRILVKNLGQAVSYRQIVVVELVKICVCNFRSMAVSAMARHGRDARATTYCAFVVQYREHFNTDSRRSLRKETENSHLVSVQPHYLRQSARPRTLALSTFAHLSPLYRISFISQMRKTTVTKELSKKSSNHWD